jgi:SAM-dependent methyltransferase
MLLVRNALRGLFAPGRSPSEAAPAKPPAPLPAQAAVTAAGPRPAGLLNLGCGSIFHPAWVNVDMDPVNDSVRRGDLRQPLAFGDGEFQAVYHCHVLEHLAHARALPFLRECHRVLAPGGTLRVVVPDLEVIARLYLTCLEGALAGDPQAARRYEWMVLELLDQLVRQRSGGEVLNWWHQDPVPCEEFIVQRWGRELRRFLQYFRALPAASQAAARAAAAAEPTPEQAAAFRAGGEPHKWMYDRWSLRVLLEAAGFADVRVCAANESGIPDFNRYQLDVAADGSTCKPDSLFMEGRKTCKNLALPRQPGER